MQEKNNKNHLYFFSNKFIFISLILLIILVIYLYFLNFSYHDRIFRHSIIIKI